MIKDAVIRLKEKNPVVHCITNYVTANDCANIVLACGASPIMADEAAEVEEVTSISSGLNINMGTINKNKAKAMLKAGMKANELNHPVVLDPVGVGVSVFRSETASKLLENIHFAVIKGNISEMYALLSGTGSKRGVDVDIEDARKSVYETARFARGLAAKFKNVIVITGETDVVADADRAYLVHNGNYMMGRITGSGCMLSAVITAFVAANNGSYLEAALAAVCMMGICGEKAYARMDAMDGNASFRNYLIDAAFNIEADEVEKLAKYELL